MRKRLLGLDIGSSTAKLVHMGLRKKKQKQFLRIMGSYTAPVPPGAVLDGEIIDPAAVASAIKPTLRKNRIKTRPAALALNGSRLILRRLGLPPLPKPKLKQLLQWEIEQYVPYSAQDAEYNFISLEQTPKQHVVFLAASTKRIVEALISTARLLSLKPLLVEPGILALYRWVQYCQPDYANNLVLCDFGARSVDILIATKGQPVMARTVVAEGDQAEIEQELLIQLQRSLDFASSKKYILPNTYIICAGGRSRDTSFSDRVTSFVDLDLAPMKDAMLSGSDLLLFGTSLGLGLGWWGGGLAWNQTLDC